FTRAAPADLYTLSLHDALPIFVSTYGDIPLITEPVNSVKADFIRNPAAEIHALMEEDFKFATEHLPKPGEEDAPGRITQGAAWQDRKSTRLNSSHVKISYAVFC